MNWYRFKEALNWIVIGVVATAILLWAWQQDQDKESIVIATASKGGYYFEFGKHLEAELKRIAGDRYNIEILATSGSVNNSELLRKGAVDVGILAIGSVSLHNISIVAPLWKDYSHIVVRTDSNATSLQEFEGKPFILGVQGSGYRTQAKQLMDFFSVDDDTMLGNDLYFKELLNNTEIEGTIVTTGLLNPDLRDVLFTGQFKLMPVTPAEGFAFNHIFHSQDLIPAGVYPSINGPIPAVTVPTISTMAVMAASRDISDEKVKIILQALNSSDLRSKAPVLLDVNPTSDRILRLLQLHPVSAQYYDPNFGLNIFSDAMATLESLKEIIVLFLLLIVALIYKLRTNRVRKAVNQQNRIANELFAIFEDLLKIEHTLKEISDIRLLRQYEYQVLKQKKRTVEIAKSGGLETNDVYLSVINECNELSAQISNRLQIYQQKALSQATHTGA
ncbi:TAXI family TRAP transporter solute-binding subunit [Reinekea sp.]|jgi:TRAP transporter TAXI family solute receptor|uniref:TAXI family TRAP transporter solute-binding subunit n=1 Tax=Reinekea sp. TaxID=1970455 RepID=UPI002A807064|nr:TAXI family TRAP transporter solute-binding subunit [Reinekea sp.]